MLIDLHVNILGVGSGVLPKTFVGHFGANGVILPRNLVQNLEHFAKAGLAPPSGPAPEVLQVMHTLEGKAFK